MNELEQHLRQVPLKSVPANWRADILATAKVGQAFPDLSGSNERISASRPLSSERGIYAASRWMARKTHEILDAVAVRTLKRTEVRAPGQSEPTCLYGRLHSLFWPHPKAWAGLAAAWVVILILNVSQRDGSPMRAENSAPPSPEMTAELRQQHQLLAELLGAPEVSVADRPRTKSSQPHTQVMSIPWYDARVWNNVRLSGAFSPDKGEIFVEPPLYR